MRNDPRQHWEEESRYEMGVPNRTLENLSFSNRPGMGNDNNPRWEVDRCQRDDIFHLGWCSISFQKITADEFSLIWAIWRYSEMEW